MAVMASARGISFKQILVATDLSPASLASLPYVVSIAQRFGATVFVAHVIPISVYETARPQSMQAVTTECRAGAQEKLKEITGELRAQGIEARTLLGEGDVGVVLSSWIDEHGFDLMAMGTTGRSGVRKLVLGSMAEEMIRVAECPVLTVGPEVSNEAPSALNNILCATDFSPGRSACGIVRAFACRTRRITADHRPCKACGRGAGIRTCITAATQ